MFSKRKLIFYTFLILWVVLGGLLRLLRLTERPLHHDEANQMVRCGDLLRQGTYTYDPDDHHGPTLYYLTLPFSWLLAGGDYITTGESVYRAVPAVFGTALILLPLLLVRRLPAGALVFCAAFTALSPTLTYYSRFYIQEMLLVFFTFAAMVCGWRAIWSRHWAWFVLTGASIGLMHATKETCVLAWFAVAAALLAMEGWRAKVWQAHWSVLRGVCKPELLLSAAGAAVLVSVLCYSNGFTSWQGVRDSVACYFTHVQRGLGAEKLHIFPWRHYFDLLLHVRHGRLVWGEALIVILAAVGALRALCLRPDGPRDAVASFFQFYTFYTMAITAIYCTIPYKTPWCMTSFLHAMIMLAGFATYELGTWFNRTYLGRIVFALALGLGWWHLYQRNQLANGRFAAYERNPLVYAQTTTNYRRMIARIHELARLRDNDLFIAVAAHPRNTWPTPWYLRMYRAGCWTDIADVPFDHEPDILILDQRQHALLPDAVRDSYEAFTYGLRPGVMIACHIRTDLWRRFMDDRQ